MAVDGRTGAVVGMVLLGAAAVGVGAGVLLDGRDGPSGQSTEVAATGAPAGSGPAGSGPAGSGPTSSGPASSSPAGGSPTSARPAPKIPAPVPGGKPVPVYVLGQTALGPRLYREFRAGTAASAADPVAAALAGLARTPADPDYRSPWAGLRARSTRAGAAVTVTFPAAPDLRSRDAALAVQQVVWTVTAADPSVRRVRVVAPGLPGGPPAGRADQVDVLAPVWLLDPVDRAAVGATMTMSGTASVFEATVSIEVRRGTSVVARTTATAAVGAPDRGDWTATVTVPPGDYVVSAYEVSEQDGSRVAVDTKRITVSGR